MLNPKTLNPKPDQLRAGSQWQQAIYLLNSMPSFAVEADIISYNSAISSCGKGRLWQAAVDLFHSIPNANLAPDVVSFNAAISACEKGEEWQLALQFFELMPRRTGLLLRNRVQGLGSLWQGNPIANLYFGNKLSRGD